MTYTYSLTAEQRSALQLAVSCAKFAWEHRASVLREFMPQMATEIDERLLALKQASAILHRPQFSADLAPYTDIDEGKEPRYESPESAHGVGATF